MRIRTKSKILDSTVCPIMTYAQDTSTEKTRTRQMLEANETKILRKVSKTKIDRKGSQQIRESSGIQPIN